VSYRSRPNLHRDLHPGEGPRGHEAPHHAAVLELEPDGVCLVWASFLEEPLGVVRGWPQLTLVTSCGAQDAPHIGAARLPVIVVECVPTKVAMLTLERATCLCSLGEPGGGPEA
jgi:hypothetical protein